MQTLNVRGSCTRCSGLVITDDSTGERFCQKCGNVIIENAEESRPERRLFLNESDSSRIGIPNSLAIHDRGLATLIGNTSKDSTGKSLSPTMRKDIQRLRIWDARSKTKNNEKNLRSAFIELDKLKDKLTLSDTIIEKAALIYRKAVGKGLVKGRSIPHVLAAAAYAACRNSGTPRTLTDFSDALNIKKKSVSASYRMLLNEFDMKMPVTDSMTCISKIASKIGLDERTKRYACKILSDAINKEMTAGKGPMGLAAASLYIACIKYDLKITQKEFSNASGVTEVTIRNRSHALQLGLDLK